MSKVKLQSLTNMIAKPVCKTGGVLAPRAMCGSVSVYHDDKGHRCMAHGNTKCKHKVINRDKGSEK